MGEARGAGFLPGNVTQAQLENIEAARLANSSGKLMLAVTNAAVALERLQHGTKQSVTVKHLTVSRGGQAIVAGVIRRRPGKLDQDSPLAKRS